MTHGVPKQNAACRYLGKRRLCYQDLALKFGYSKKRTNPNPSPTGTRFGFVLFGGPEGIRLARLRALGRSRSQQSTGLLLCAARPSSPIKQKADPQKQV